MLSYLYVLRGDDSSLPVCSVSCMYSGGMIVLYLCAQLAVLRGDDSTLPVCSVSCMYSGDDSSLLVCSVSCTQGDDSSLPMYSGG